MIKHGMSNHRFYNKWGSMMDRCYKKNNPKYNRYGGRGILVSEEFHSPKVFIEYIESLPGFGINNQTTLDRINNDGWYERGNLRWANITTQNLNKQAPPKYGLKGVYKRGKVWRCQVHLNNTSLYVGQFDTKEKAAAARAEYIKDKNLEAI